MQAVREFRSESKRGATKKLAEVPYLFDEIRQPESDYVLIPLHSSEQRRYVPIAFFTKDFILNNSCAALPNATRCHFGVLTCAMHMAWMRQVCGRLESRYLNNLVYNNFPFPVEPTPEQQTRIENAAQAILDALTSQLEDEERGTLVIVQNRKADEFFNATQQEPLTALMQLHEAGNLSVEDESELESLVEAELNDAQQRAKALLHKLTP